MGLGDDLIAHLGIQRCGQHSVEQCTRVGLGQTRDDQLGHTEQVAARNACGEDDGHRLRHQAARNEGQDLRRRQIKPLLVVHQAQQRPFVGDVREQAQNCQRDEKPVRRRPRADAERRPQGVALRGGQTVEQIEHRRAQLVQTGECQLHLRLDPGSPRHPTARRSPRHVVQQGGLADAGFAMNDERATLTGSKGLDELFEHAAFGAASDQFQREPRPTAAPRRFTGLTLYLQARP